MEGECAARRTHHREWPRKQTAFVRMMGACVCHRAAKPDTGICRCTRSVPDARSAIQRRVCASSKFGVSFCRGGGDTSSVGTWRIPGCASLTRATRANTRSAAVHRCSALRRVRRYHDGFAAGARCASLTRATRAGACTALGNVRAPPGKYKPRAGGSQWNARRSDSCASRCVPPASQSDPHTALFALRANHVGSRASGIASRASGAGLCATQSRPIASQFDLRATRPGLRASEIVLRAGQAGLRLTRIRLRPGEFGLREHRATMRTSPAIRLIPNRRLRLPR